MGKDPKDRARAEAEFKQKAQEGAQARVDYELAADAIRNNTARLRALRLAREAADKAAGVVPGKAKKTAAGKSVAGAKKVVGAKKTGKGKGKGSKSVTLSDWLSAQRRDGRND